MNSNNNPYTAVTMPGTVLSPLCMLTHLLFQACTNCSSNSQQVTVLNRTRTCSQCFTNINSFKPHATVKKPRQGELKQPSQGLVTNDRAGI